MVSTKGPIKQRAAESRTVGTRDTMNAGCLDVRVWEGSEAKQSRVKRGRNRLLYVCVHVCLKILHRVRKHCAHFRCAFEIQQESRECSTLAWREAGLEMEMLASAWRLELEAAGRKEHCGTEGAGREEETQVCSCVDL